MDTVNSGANGRSVMTPEQATISQRATSRSESENSDETYNRHMEFAAVEAPSPTAIKSSIKRPSSTRSPRFCLSTNEKKADPISCGSQISDKSFKFKNEQVAMKNGPKTCLQCGCSRTPLWRNGPLGPQSLCNACGLRYNKMKAGKKCRTNAKDISLAVASPSVCDNRSVCSLKNVESIDEIKVVTPKKKRSSYTAVGTPSPRPTKRRIIRSPAKIEEETEEEFLADLYLGASLLRSFQNSRSRLHNALVV